MWQKIKLVIEAIWIIFIFFVGFNGISEMRKGEHHKATLSLFAAVCMFNVLEDFQDV